MGKTRRLLIPSFFLLVTILACNLQSVGAPTSTPNPVATNVAQTVAAQMSMLTPSAPAVSTAIPNAGIPTATKVPTATLVCDQAAFVSETIPDGTNFLPGAAFTKSWRLKNTGTCTWTTSYALVFVSGDALNASASIPLPGSVAPAQEVDLAVNMQAPTTPGSYTSNWELRNASGVLFGVEPGSSAFWAKISVVAPTATSLALHIPPIIVPIPPLQIAPTTQEGVNQVTAPAGGIGYANVHCPSGSVVTGGGFAGSNSLFVYTSLEDGNGWQVYGQNTSASGQALNAYAICLSALSGATSQQVLNPVTVPAGGTGNAIVACPAGSIVTGGGFASSPTLTVYNSSEDGNSWQVYAQNSSASSQGLNAYAICLSGASGASRQEVSNQVTAPDLGVGQGVSTCPSGSLLTGGGFDGSIHLPVYTNSASGNGWEVDAQNKSASSLPLIAYAICLTLP